jgi:periplasmic protein TonB
MGFQTAAENEILDTEGSIGKTPSGRAHDQAAETVETKTGNFEHNGRMGLASESPRSRPPKAEEPQLTMANELPLISESESEAAAAYLAKHEFDGFLGRSFEEKPIWAGLYESVRDVFFPVKLPPLQLTSTPIPVPDRMKVKANPWAIGFSSGINLAILAALLYFGARMFIEKVVQPHEAATPIDVGDFKLQGPAGQQAGGGGGGGSHDIVDPIKGRLPKRSPDPITPPIVQQIDKPKLAIEPAINVQESLKLPDNPTLPNLGVSKSQNVTLASNGEGGGAGIGTGQGNGIGQGTGNGYGPGYGGNAGGGVYRVGGGISAPVPLNTVEAEFSDEARRAKYQGVCLIQLIVDAQGNPQNPRVIRPLGMGLDEKALEAVRKYKFKPAMKGSTPVPVMITVDVDFRLY